MITTITIKLELEKDTESVSDFRKKFESFKEHVARMQAKGLLPVGDIVWVTGVSKKPPAVVNVEWNDRVVHQNGSRLM